MGDTDEPHPLPLTEEQQWQQDLAVGPSSALALLFIPLIGAFAGSRFRPKRPPLPEPDTEAILLPRVMVSEGWARFEIRPRGWSAAARDALVWAPFLAVAYWYGTKTNFLIPAALAMAVGLFPSFLARFSRATPTGRGLLLAVPAASLVALSLVNWPNDFLSTPFAAFIWLWLAFGVRALCMIPFSALRIVVEVNEEGVCWWPQLFWTRVGASRRSAGPIALEPLGGRYGLRVGDAVFDVDSPSPGALRWLVDESNDRIPDDASGDARTPIWLSPHKMESLFLIPGVCWLLFLFSEADLSVSGLQMVLVPIFAWAMMVPWATRLTRRRGRDSAVQ